MRHRAPILATLAATGVFAAPALAAAPTIHATPKPVQRGHKVHVFGRVPGCPKGDAVTLISKAFSHKHDFAGLPAVFAKVGKHSKYSIHRKIPATKAPGTYALTGRCGGGNLGVTAHIKVVR